MLFVLGLILIGVEIFIVPGFGVIGVSGILLVVGSLVLVTLERMPQTTQDWVSMGGTLTTFALRPNDAGARVQTLTLRIDDQTHLIQQLLWNYKNGEAMAMTPTWTASGSYRLISTVAIAARFKAYDVDGTLRLTDYRLNVSAPP